MEKNKIDRKINFYNCEGKYDELLDIIKTGVEGKLETEVDKYRITIKCDNGRHVLRVKSNLIKTLVIEHLEIDNKRKGIASKVLKWLEEYGFKNNFDILTAESVLPNEEEMINFCAKNNLIRDNFNSYNYSKKL